MGTGLAELPMDYDGRKRARGANKETTNLNHNLNIMQKIILVTGPVCYLLNLITAVLMMRYNTQRVYRRWWFYPCLLFAPVFLFAIALATIIEGRDKAADPDGN